MCARSCPRKNRVAADFKGVMDDGITPPYGGMAWFRDCVSRGHMASDEEEGDRARNMVHGTTC